MGGGDKGTVSVNIGQGQVPCANQYLGYDGNGWGL
jgi:hypothetical protein